MNPHLKYWLTPTNYTRLEWGLILLNSASLVWAGATGNWRTVLWLLCLSIWQILNAVQARYIKHLEALANDILNSNDILLKLVIELYNHYHKLHHATIGGEPPIKVKVEALSADQLYKDKSRQN